MQRFQRLCFCSLLVVCISCSSMNAITPLPDSGAAELTGEEYPPPEFISYTTDSSDEFDTGTQDICAAINEYHVWEVGDFGNAVSESIQKHARVFVNGQQVGNLKFRIDAAAYIRFSESNRAELGSHNVSTNLCFDASALSDGIYIVTLQFLSTSGQGYSHTWIFEMKAQ